MTNNADPGAARSPRRLSIGADGLARRVRREFSPNFDARPAGTEISLLIVHNISLPPGEFGGDDVLRFFCNTLDCSSHAAYSALQGLRVSAHFFVRRSGELIQLVSCAERAWHAGQSAWRGRTRCNDFSVGVELEGTDTEPYEAVQYGVLAALTTALMRRYPIAEVVGHSDVAPERKTDPGPAFDWRRFKALLPTRKRS